MAGQVTGRLLLTTKDFDAALKHAGANAKKFNAELKRLSGTTAKKLVRDSDKIRRNSVANTKKMKEGWWKKFGAIALGFTIAYRAMNAFEAALSKVISVIGEAIRESGVLAETQAKLAFWYQLHSEEAVDFSEAFKRAAVNVEELRKASIRSISTLEELAIGIDEIAQTIGGIAPQSIAAMASVVDFTVMVAQTTGSTTRQIRQELQALMDGRIKTTDQLARSLMKVGILTKKDLQDLREMRNQVVILNKVFRLLGERQRVVNAILLRSSVELALKFWEKSIRNVIIQSVKLSSELKTVDNIFAETMAKHAEEFMEKFSEKDMDRFIILMTQLNWVLDKSLSAFEEMIRGVGKLAAVIDNISPKTVALGKAFATLLIVRTIVPLVRLLTIALGKMLVRITLSLAALVTGVTATLAVTAATLLGLVVLFRTAMSLEGDTIKRDMGILRTALSTIWDQMFDDMQSLFSKSLGVIQKTIRKMSDAFYNLGRKIKDLMIIDESMKGKGFLGTLFDENAAKDMELIGNTLIGISNALDVVGQADEILKNSLINVEKIVRETIKDPFYLLGPALKKELEYIKSVWGPQFVIEFKKLFKQIGFLSDSAADALIKKMSSFFDPRPQGRPEAEALEGLGVPKGKLKFAELTSEEIKEFKKGLKDYKAIAMAWQAYEKRFYGARGRLIIKYIETLETLFLSERDTIKKLAELRSVATIDLQAQLRMFDLTQFKNRYEEMRDGFTDAVKTMTDYWMDFLKTGKFEFGRFITDVLAQMARLVIAKYLVENLATAFGSLIGKIFSFGGGLPAGSTLGGGSNFAKGGVLAGPTYFPRYGAIGGEAGKEALLPLSRLSGGKLGVGVSGMFNVNIINNTGAEIEQSETANRQGGRNLTVVIGMAMGQDVTDGGPLHQSLRRTFGLRPNLVGRS